VLVRFGLSKQSDPTEQTKNKQTKKGLFLKNSLKKFIVPIKNLRLGASLLCSPKMHLFD